jgi:DNA gyrase subunit A
MRVADLRVMGRNTQGVRLINLRGNDSIASITKVEHSEDEEPEENVVADAEAMENPETENNTESAETEAKE